MRISAEEQQLIVDKNKNKLVYKTEFAKNFVIGMYMLDVTDKAKNIFGEELVESAWLSVEEILNNQEHSINDLSNYNIFAITEIEECSNLLMAFESAIYITFVTGKIVKLWTSEWGGLERVHANF